MDNFLKLLICEQWHGMFDPHFNSEKRLAIFMDTFLYNFNKAFPKVKLTLNFQKKKLIRMIKKDQ